MRSARFFSKSHLNLMLQAAGAAIPTQLLRREPVQTTTPGEREFQRRQRLLTKGHKEFYINCVYIVALNQRNADRKYEKMRRDGTLPL